jgi:hypothetical protein
MLASEASVPSGEVGLARQIAARANPLCLLVDNDLITKFAGFNETEDLIEKQNPAFAHGTSISGTIPEESLMLLNPCPLFLHNAVNLGLPKIFRDNQLDGRILSHAKSRVPDRTPNDRDSRIHSYSGNRVVLYQPL